MDELAIIIVSYNTKELTKQCLDSVFLSDIKLRYRVWVVDNGSTDGSVEMIKKYPMVELIETGSNLGFARANNLVLEKNSAKWNLLLNSDTIVSEGVIDKLVDEAEQRNCGVFSCRLTFTDGRFQANGGNLPKPMPVFNWLTGADDLFRKLGMNISTFHFMKEAEFSSEIGWVAGTVMLIKKSVVDKVGFLDDKIFMYAEDVDYCWRAEGAGFEIGWTKNATIIHIGGGSSKNPRLNQWRGEFAGLVYLYRKYYGSLAALLLRLFIDGCIVGRLLAFGIVGKWDYVKAYGKIIISY